MPANRSDLERRFEWLMGQIEDLRLRLDSRSAASQLAHSSFDSGPGHGIDEVDPITGQVVASYGTQFDGSHGAVPYSGPNPPRPTAPLVRTGPGTATIGWDGMFTNEAGVRDFTVVPTLDMTHVEVHVSDDPLFTAEFAETLVGTINTMRGGWCPVVTGAGTFYTRLVSRSSSGKKSAASPPVSVTVEGMNVDELREEWEAGDNALGNALAQTNEAQSDLAGKMTGLATALDAPNLQTITGQQIAARIGLFLELGVDKLTAGTANIGTAVADKLFSNIFSTRKLTADQVLIGQGGNRIVDADFTDAAAMQQRLANLNAFPPSTGRNAWFAVPAAGTDPVGLRTNSSLNGTLTYAEVFWPGSTTQPMYANAIQVKPGDRFALFGWVTTSQTSSVTWHMQSFNIETPGTTTTITVPSTVQNGLTNGRRWVRGEYTVPATGVTAVYPRLLFTNQTTSTNSITVWGGAAMRQLDQEALALFGDSIYSTIPYDFRVTIGGRPIQSSGEPVPGLRFSYRKKDMTDVPPLHDAGIISTAPTGTGVGSQMQSSAVDGTTNSPFSRMWTDPAVAGMETRQGVQQRFLLETTPTAFNLRTIDGLADQAAVRTDGDGVLDLYGKEGITFSALSAAKPITSTGVWSHNGDLTVSNNLTVASLTTTSVQSRSVMYGWARSIPNANATDMGTNGIGSLSYDPVNSNVAANVIVTYAAATGFITIVQAGVFSVTMLSFSPASMTGRSFLQISETGTGKPVVRSSVSTGEDSGSVAITRYYPAGTVITFGVFQTSGSTRAMTGKVIVVRHP